MSMRYSSALLFPGIGFDCLVRSISNAHWIITQERRRPLLAGWYNTAQRDRPKFPENDKTI